LKEEKDKAQLLYQQFIQDCFEDEKQYLYYQEHIKDIESQKQAYQNYFIQLEALDKQKTLLEEKTKDYQLCDLVQEKQQLDDLLLKRDQAYTKYHESLYVFQQNDKIL